MTQNGYFQATVKEVLRLRERPLQFRSVRFRQSERPLQVFERPLQNIESNVERYEASALGIGASASRCWSVRFEPLDISGYWTAHIFNVVTPITFDLVLYWTRVIYCWKALEV